MRTSRSISLVALAAALLLVCVPLALAAPGDGGGGEPKLTIDSWPNGAMGEISGAGPKCSAGRPVTVYEQVGAKPDPKADKRLGEAAATRTGAKRARSGQPLPPFYLWLLKAGSAERVYAEAGPREGCADLRSPTISLPLRDQPIKECPARTEAYGEKGDGFCHISLHHDADVCPGFSRDFPLYPCFGKIFGNPPWQQVLSDFEYGTYGDFRWLPMGGGSRRVIIQSVVTFLPFAGLEGFMKGAQYAEFNVERGWTLTPFGEFVTPRTSIRAGELGGPLYLDFRGGATGADIYIRGYLLKVR